MHWWQQQGGSVVYIGACRWLGVTPAIETAPNSSTDQVAPPAVALPATRERINQNIDSIDTNTSIGIGYILCFYPQNQCQSF